MWYLGEFIAHYNRSQVIQSVCRIAKIDREDCKKKSLGIMMPNKTNLIYLKLAIVIYRLPHLYYTTLLLLKLVKTYFACHNKITITMERRNVHQKYIRFIWVHIIWSQWKKNLSFFNISILCDIIWRKLVK